MSVELTQTQKKWAFAGAALLGLVMLARLLALPQWRRQVIERARQHAANRTPYQWGGGHSGPSWGLDCSGLVIDSAKSAGIDVSAYTSSDMKKLWPAIEKPQPGDVALYAPRHVVLVESFDPSTGVATIIGANGGTPETISPAVAAAQGAFVRREPTHLYRSGFMHFASFEHMVPQHIREA